MWLRLTRPGPTESGQDVVEAVPRPEFEDHIGRRSCSARQELLCIGCGVVVGAVDDGRTDLGGVGDLPFEQCRPAGSATTAPALVSGAVALTAQCVDDRFACSNADAELVRQDSDDVVVVEVHGVAVAALGTVPLGPPELVVRWSLSRRAVRRQGGRWGLADGGGDGTAAFCRDRQRHVDDHVFLAADVAGLADRGAGSRARARRSARRHVRRAAGTESRRPQ